MCRYPLMLYLFYLWNGRAPMFRRKKELYWRTMKNVILSPDAVQDSYSLLHYDKGDQLDIQETKTYASAHPYFLEHKWESPGMQQDQPYDREVRRMTFWWAVLVVLYQVSVFYRYTYLYVQVLLHTGLVILIFSVILIVRACSPKNIAAAKRKEQNEA